MAAQPTSTLLRIRTCHKDELPTVMQMCKRAFKGRPMNEAVMPLHLRTNREDPDADELAFRLDRALGKFDDPSVHNIVVVDGEDVVVGWALWTAPPPPSPVEKAGEDRAEEEEEEAKWAEEAGKLPSYLDREAWWTIVRKTNELWRMLKGVMTEEEYTRSWRLDGIAVDPIHHRRGIGKMLVGWGEERAAKEEPKTIRFLASEMGANLYRAMGYEEVGKIDILGGMEYAFFKRL